MYTVCSLSEGGGSLPLSPPAVIASEGHLLARCAALLQCAILNSLVTLPLLCYSVERSVRKLTRWPIQTALTLARERETEREREERESERERERDRQRERERINIM